MWQLSHCAVVGMWFVGLPSAFTLLWQSVHRPVTAGVAVAWLNVPVAQVVVELWHVSHCALVAMCVTGLVCAFCARYVPLWQVAQFPAASGPVVPAWLIVAGANAVKLLWHVSHCAVVGMWFVGLPSAWVPL